MLAMKFTDRGDELDIDRLKVSDIIFDYNNDEIIRLLKKRGIQIAKHNYEGSHEVERELDEYLKSHREQIRTPNSFFITFEDEDGYIIGEDFLVKKGICGVKRYQKKKRNIPLLFGEKLKFEEVTNPSNIKWENRNFTPMQKLVRVILIQIALVCILALAYAIIYLIKNEIAVLQAMWPKISYCSVIEGTFVGQQNQFLEAAISEYNSITSQSDY